MRIKDHVFLIAGGASGLGAAAARGLAAAGANIVIADVDDERGAALTAELGGHVRYVATDVVDPSQVHGAIDCAVTQFGALHGLLNCAGIAPAERVLGKRGPHGLESFCRVIQINLVGSFNVLRLAAEAMARNAPAADGERGIIINTASIAAFEGQIGQAAYSASKGGMVAMALPIARELAGLGIRVMTIAPGVFDTPLVQGMGSEVRASLAAQVPFPSRLGEPDEYARLAAFIIENRMLNAEVIRLDGALRLVGR